MKILTSSPERIHLRWKISKIFRRFTIIRYILPAFLRFAPYLCSIISPTPTELYRRDLQLDSLQSTRELRIILDLDNSRGRECRNTSRFAQRARARARIFSRDQRNAVQE